MTHELDDLLVDLVDECTQQDVKPRGYWKDFSNCVAFAQEIKRTHGWDSLPSSTILKNEGYLGFLSGLQDHHNGFRKFREMINGVEAEAVSGYWNDIDNCVRMAKKIIQEQGYLPGVRKLNDLGHNRFANAISKSHGGFINFRKNLGLTLLRGNYNISLPEGHADFIDLDKCTNIAQELIQQHGYFPTGSELNELGFEQLHRVIKNKHGGMRNQEKNQVIGMTKITDYQSYKKS